MAVSPIKSAVEACYQRNAGNVLCNSTDPATVQSGVSSEMLVRAASADLVGSVTLANDGGAPVITAIPAVLEGFTAADTYVITGSVNLIAAENTITDWIESGQGCVEGYC